MNFTADVFKTDVSSPQSLVTNFAGSSFLCRLKFSKSLKVLLPLFFGFLVDVLLKQRLYECGMAHSSVLLFNFLLSFCLSCSFCIPFFTRIIRNRGITKRLSVFRSGCYRFWRCRTRHAHTLTVWWLNSISRSRGKQCQGWFPIGRRPIRSQAEERRVVVSDVPQTGDAAPAPDKPAVLVNQHTLIFACQVLEPASERYGSFENTFFVVGLFATAMQLSF